MAPARPAQLPGGGGGGSLASRPGMANRPGIQQPGIAARPGSPGLSRPAISQGNRPGGGLVPGATRPGIANRPSVQPPIAGNRPGMANRPGISTLPAGLRPGDLTRPNLPGAGNRPGQGGGGVRPPGITTLPGQITRPGQGGGGVRPPGITTLPGQITRPGQGGGGEPPPWLNRPGQGTRPGQGGAGEPPPWLANRPDGGNRPGGGGGGRPPQRPGDLTRPSLPGLVNRPQTGGGNGIGNIGSGNINSGNTIGSGNTNVVNRPEYNINNNQFTNVNRPGWGGGGGNWGGGGGNWGGGGGYWGGGYNDAWASRPWSDYHSGWYSGNWNWGGALPSVWASGLATGSWLSGPSTVVYSNPYYAEPATALVDPGLNYAAPIAAPTVDQQVIAYPAQTSVEQTVVVQPAETTPTAPAPTESAPAPPAAQPEDPTVKEANRLFEAARNAFKGGDYARAQEQVEKAIKLLPSDPTLHEFRALTLFAQKRFQDAAATLYAVLSNGPGWSWETMIGLYGDPEVYTQQLRALEQYQREHPDAGDGHFVLAYHYLVMGSKDQAVDQFKAIVKVSPQDKLSASLLAALTTNPEASTTPPDAKQ